jgi:hypothetical protein
MLRYAAAFAIAALIAGAAPARTPAHTPACLHGPAEAAAQRTRRNGALEYAKVLNRLQAEGFLQAQRYFLLDTLPGLPPLPKGFAAQLSTDGATYAFSVKDTLDPCGFAYFSDQTGVVYSATPVR